MPAPLTGDIISLHSSFYVISSHFNNMMNDCNALAGALTAEGNPSSGIAASNMAVHMWDVRNDLSFGANSTRYWLVKCLQWIDNNWPTGGGGATVDMDAILDAMWASETWQTLLFIAYIDAMRGSISEKTVTETAMGNYLRHFL